MRHIYVGNIGFLMSEAALRSHFEVFGQVKGVRARWNFAIIEMNDDKAAERAVYELNSRTTWVLRRSEPPFTEVGAA